jgi:hypothetical protein
VIIHRLRRSGGTAGGAAGGFLRFSKQIFIYFCPARFPLGRHWTFMPIHACSSSARSPFLSVITTREDKVGFLDLT